MDQLLERKIMSESNSPSTPKSTDSATGNDSSTGGLKDTSAPQPTQVTPDSSGVGSTSGQTVEGNAQPEPGQEVTSPSGDSNQPGVQVGGLTYTTNEDGTRNYPEQQPVKTQDDPTPQPEQVNAEAPQPTQQPAGQ